MFRALVTTFLFTLCAEAVEFPLFFEPNRGQAPAGVEFVSRANGVASYISPGEARFPVGDSLIHMQLKGAAGVAGEGVGRLPGLSSYFAGKTAREWHTGIPQFDRVVYRDVYPGVDLVYYGNRGQLEYDFVVAPGADASRIRIAYGGLTRLRVDRNGDLLLSAGGGEIRQRRPTVYEEIGGKRIPVHAAYRLSGAEVAIELGAHDARSTLVVDPVLEYSTFLGANAASQVLGLKTDSAGNVYLAGMIWNHPFDPQTAGSAGSAVVVKFAPAQNKILYWAQLTPDGQTQAHGLAVDAAGNAYITGVTSSFSLPLVNAVQTSLAGHGAFASSGGFVTKIAPDGQSLVYSTYLAGSNYEYLNGIAIDAAGNAFVAGQTTSRDFPVLNALQPTASFDRGTCVLAKFSPAGKLLFSTFYGGSGSEGATALAVDSTGAPVIVGTTTSSDFPVKNPLEALPAVESAFVAKFAADGQSVVFATALASSYSQGTAVAVDAQNNIWAGGYLEPRFGLTLQNPLQSNPTHSFLTRLTPDGKQILNQSYFGGGVLDVFGTQAMTVDNSGSLYVAGTTYSPDFPLVDSRMQFQKKGMNSDFPLTQGTYGFVSKVSADGQRLMGSTLLGGLQYSDGISAVTVDPAGAVWVGGGAQSSDFPVTPGAYQTAFGNGNAFTAFLAKLTGWASQTAGAASFTASPAVVNLAAPTASAQPQQQMLAIAASNGSAAPFTASVTQGGGWLSISTLSGTTPAQITVSANPSGLAAGTYPGTIHLSGANLTALDIPVWLTVSAPASPLIVSASNLVLSGFGQGTVYVSTSTGTPASFTASASTSYGGNWLSVSPATATTPAALTVLANSAGLAPGSYQGTIHLAPTSGTGVDIQVALRVTQQQPAALSAAPATIAFQATAGGSQPPAQSVALNCTGCTGGYTATAVSDGNWLSATPASGSLPGSISVSANPSSVGPGSYQASVRVTAATGTAVTVPVTLIVQALPPVVTPSSLTFAGVAGGAAPPTQSLNVATNGAAIHFTASVGNATWLAASPSSGTTPAKMAVSVAGSLAAGIYSANLVISGGGGSVTVPVSFLVSTASAVLVSISPASLPNNAVSPAVTLKGSGFTTASVVHLVAGTSADQVLNTTYVDAGTLQVSLTAAMLAQGSPLSFTVVNPGAAPSNALTLTLTDPVPQFQAAGFFNAASMASPGKASPGEMITIFGSNLGPAQAASATPDANGAYPQALATVRVLFDGHAAPMLFASATEISAIVPFGIGGQTSTAVQVEYQGRQSQSVDVPVVAAAPGLFTANASGTGPGAILNGDMSQNQATGPAAVGSTIALYCTGAGLMDQPLVDGQVVAHAVKTQAPVTVTIDGQTAEVLYAGAAPTLVGGIVQVNATVPANVRSGVVPITLSIGGVTSQPGVTVAIQ